MVHLDYREKSPIYLQIMENIHGQIASGILQPGDKLPSVREMATQLPSWRIFRPKPCGR